MHTRVDSFICTHQIETHGLRKVPDSNVERSQASGHPKNGQWLVIQFIVFTSDDIDMLMIFDDIYNDI